MELAAVRDAVSAAFAEPNQHTTNLESIYLSGYSQENG